MLRLFEILSIFDWITPAIGLAQDVIHDPTPFQTNTQTYFIDYERCLESGYNANDVERLLHSHGIETWGSMISRDTFDLVFKGKAPLEFMFSIYVKDEPMATSILNQYGII